MFAVLTTVWATGTLCAEAKDAAEHPHTHRADPHNKYLLTQNARIAEVEESYSREKSGANEV